MKQIKQELNHFANLKYQKKLGKLGSTLKNGIVDAKLLSRLKIFHWNLEFPEVFSNNRGFDIIIGNPPYIRADLEEIFHVMQREFIKTVETKYHTLYEKWDIFVPFIELSLRYLLQKGGFLGYLVSNAILKHQWGP